MPRPTSSSSIEQRVLAELRRAGKSRDLSLVSPADLASIGSRRAVDIALHRLTAQGTIRRVARGLYYVPRVHPVLGEVRPTPDAIVQALAAKHRLRIQPSGAQAANLLGLSEQVPQRLVYLTDGPPRRIRYGKQEIILRRTTPRNMAAAGRVSGLVIQALRHLGAAGVTDQVVAALRKRLRPKDRRELLADAPLAPAWIADVMRAIASPAR